jgi:hypothetical protein
LGLQKKKEAPTQIQIQESLLKGHNNPSKIKVHKSSKKIKNTATTGTGRAESSGS